MALLAADVEQRLVDAVGGALRPGDSGDDVCGTTPRWVASPSGQDRVGALLRLATDTGLSVVPCGARTKLQWGAAPESVDVLLDLSGMDGLVEHASGDLVAIAQAGRRLDDLQADLSAAGQWLAVDPPRRGTVGGLVATASAGPARLLDGPVRDLVIGAHIVRADGVSARSGGKVVKNVAGYDLGRLLTGSFGTLAVLTQVAFRLQPVPPTSRYVVAPVTSGGQVAALVQSVLHSHLVAHACELDLTPGGDGQLAVHLDGIEAAVAARTRNALALLGDGAEELAEAPSWWGTEPPYDQGLLLRASAEVASVATLLDGVATACREHGIESQVRGSVAVGSLLVGAHAGTDVAMMSFLDDVRAAAGRAGGAVVVLEARPELKQRVDVWGPVRGLGLMQRVKEQFDPGRVLSPGRFVGGI